MGTGRYQRPPHSNYQKDTGNTNYRSGAYNRTTTDSYQRGSSGSTYQRDYQRGTNGNSYQRPTYDRSSQSSTYQRDYQKGANGYSYQRPTYDRSSQSSTYQRDYQRGTNGYSYQRPTYDRASQSSTYQRDYQRGTNGSNYQRGTNAGNYQRPTANSGRSGGSGSSGNPPRRKNKKRRIRPAAILFRILLLLAVLLAIWGVTRLFGKAGSKKDKPKESVAAAESVVETAQVPEEAVTRTISPFTMTFVGDVMLKNAVGNYDERGVEGLVSPGVQEVFRNSDFLMLNQEFTFGNTGSPVEGKQFTYQVDPRYAAAFKDMGVNLVSLANNHSLDYGAESLRQTFSALSSEGISYVGAGNSLDETTHWKTFNLGGANVAFLAGSRVLPTVDWGIENTQPGLFSCYDTTMMVQQIRAAKKENDLVVVYMHWGALDTTQPESYQKDMAREFVNAGADLIVGSHSHTFQGIEYINDVPVVYNLGNFLYDQTLKQSAILQVTANSDLRLSLKLIPIAGRGYRTYVQDDDAAEAGLKTLGAACSGVTVDEQGNVLAPGVTPAPAPATETQPEAPAEAEPAEEPVEESAG